MHEFSIVNALLDMCEQNAKDKKKKKITKVEIKIGKLSGVEPHLLETAFETFKEGTMCDGAKFTMHLQDVILHCQSCDKQSSIQHNRKSKDKRFMNIEECRNQNRFTHGFPAF